MYMPQGVMVVASGLLTGSHSRGAVA